MLFNGTYTVRNEATHEHRTFRIRTLLKGNLEGKRVLELLTGPDNEHDFRAFAFVLEPDARFPQDRVTVWKRCRGRAYAAYATFFELLGGETLAPVDDESWGVKGFRFGSKTYSVRLSKRCSRCNRTLTHPVSLATGVGPECAKKIGLQVEAYEIAQQELALETHGMCPHDVITAAQVWVERERREDERQPREQHSYYDRNGD